MWENWLHHNTATGQVVKKAVFGRWFTCCSLIKVLACYIPSVVDTVFMSFDVVTASVKISPFSHHQYYFHCVLSIWFTLTKSHSRPCLSYIIWFMLYVNVNFFYLHRVVFAGGGVSILKAWDYIKKKGSVLNRFSRIWRLHEIQINMYAINLVNSKPKV
jgi:hypothetical protein